jgi:ethanolamine utilization protein EutP (predicted NTPase)
MASIHLKRSQQFANAVAILAMKLVGVHAKSDLIEAAKLLTENTTDSQCVVLSASDEPIFTLRAKDPCSIAGLRAWIAEAERTHRHMDKLMDARAALREFETWRPS